MNKNIHTEKDSHGSKPNKKSKNDEWVEENFSSNTNPSSHRDRKKPSKKMKKK